ncbi:MFS transporter [Cupriavidus sp. 8B]
MEHKSLRQAGGRFPVGTRARGVAVLLCLAVIGFNLRTPMTSLGSVLSLIQDSVTLAGWRTGLLTALPSVCFSLFGLASPALVRRMGDETCLFACLGLTACGLLLRGAGGGSWLFFGQALSCAGIAVINVLLPGYLKRRFPERTGLLTGVYSMALCAGAALASGLTVHMAQQLHGSWELALAAWAAPAGLATAGCALVFGVRNDEKPGLATPGVQHGAVWTSPLAWQVSLFMGFQSSLAYIVFGWLPSLLQWRGLDAVSAGTMCALSVIVQAPASLAVAIWASRTRDQRAGMAVASLTCAAALWACLLLPLGNLQVAAVALGVAQGSLLALGLTVIGMRAPDGAVAASLSGMSQSVGYAIAALGPVVVGLLHARAGGWWLVGCLCLAIACAAALCGLGAGRARLIPARRRTDLAMVGGDNVPW